MTPARVLYLIRYQGPQWFEPRTYFGNNTLKNVYDYEPIQPEWEPEVTANLLGVQGSLWTEFTNSPEDAEYLIFPRLAAVAEIAWSGKDRKDWPGFLKRLDVLTQHYDYLGVNYARSMFNIDHLVTGNNDTLKVTLTCIRPDMEIRYTTDGNEPVATSSLYTDSLVVTNDITINAATFANGKQMGKTLTLPLHWNKATARPVQDRNSQTYRLTNGLRGSNKQSDFEWCGWYDEDATFTIDLGKTEAINEITIGNYPRKIDEYLALGKPVIATRTKTMSIFDLHVWNCTNTDEYIAAIREALQTNNPEKILQRIKFAHTHTWKNSVDKMYSYINL